MEGNHANFGSRMGAIFAAAGSAVGLAIYGVFLPRWVTTVVQHSY